MLVFFALGNAKVLSFALGNAKLPDVSSFASQWNIGFNLKKSGEAFSEHINEADADMKIQTMIIYLYPSGSHWPGQCYIC